MAHPRKVIREYLITNGSTTEAQLITACEANGARTERCGRVIARLIARGKIIKSGADHTWA